MRLSELLAVREGVTAIIGSGGKTTLLYTLAHELARERRVIVCTSTHIYPPDTLPVLTGADGAALSAALARERCVCVGTAAADGKLGAPDCPFAALAAAAPYVLVEADGSKGLPLKAHESWEPVIPAGAGRTLLVVGIRGIGQPIREAAHRPRLFAARAGRDEDAPAAPEDVAAVLRAEALADAVFINQVETPAQRALARRLAFRLPCPVYAGALQKGEWSCLQS